MRVKRLLQDNLVLLTIVLLAAVTAIVEPGFLSSANLVNILRQFGPLSFVALGMTMVIIGGFIDLSVAGIISLVAVVTISLIDPIGQVGALAVGVAAGTGMGLLNSLLILSCGALTSAEALFITFGMSSVYSAAALLYTDGATRHMSWLSSKLTVFEAIGSGGVGILSVSSLLFLAMMAALFFFQTRTRRGREICLTGGNKVAAALAGVPVKRAIATVFAISGAMSAIGSIVLFSRITTASPLLGQGYETNAILAVVVGGTPMAGGKGSVVRTMLGVMLVTLLSNCMNLLSVSTYMQSVLRGAVLIVAIWLDNRRER
ncbi:MAG: ABC transporter permease [Eubacteriales bacterium]|nr:ABC transporter permease [Christensenellaceae bacterium]MEA5066526.1 ABC transporter permease [Eubacteriales bacterium]